MSIFSTLLTGVSIVGKVCQGLAGALGANNCRIPNIEDDATEMYESEMTVGGARFYTSYEKDKGYYENYVHNPTTKLLSVCLPNVNNLGGIELLVSPKKSRPMGNILNGSVPPSTEIIIGPISETNVNDSNAGLQDTAVKIGVNQLPLNNKPVQIAGIVLTADVNGTLTVKSFDSAIGAITYFSATSDKGICTEYRDTIIPEATNEELKAGVTRSYSIPFKEMGYSREDTLNCYIYFSVYAGNENRIAAHKKLCCKPPKSYEVYLKSKGIQLD